MTRSDYLAFDVGPVIAVESKFFAASLTTYEQNDRAAETDGTHLLHDPVRMDTTSSAKTVLAIFLSQDFHL